ncbi:transcription termination factor 1-like [Hippocampus zosterae]|uniref:transcription termination factor 1-like n=1 Tax=Hippocampus zosterae TaxID=109293 RepID=UPI00223D799E|nr:transcription termination factor 1-like [Hippocampus zosterae]XP_051923857.1 transcription termination factor 1-like [Hippocampus zosterae]
MEAELPLCGLSPFPPADKERRSAVPSPVDISTPNTKKKKKKKGLEDDHSLLLTDGQALTQKKKREEENKHMHEMKEREESDEINMTAADGSTRKQKKKIRDEENRVAPATGLTDQETKKKKTEDKVEDDNGLLPASAQKEKKKKKNLEEAHSAFPADKSSRKKRNRQEEKDDVDDGVSTADELACKTKKSKKIEEAEDDDGVLPADVQKEKKKKKKKEKRQEENMLSDDSAASKHKKKKKRDNEGEESIFPADAHTRTKERTAEEEGGVLLPGMQEMEEEEVATATATTEENDGPEAGDGSVSVETDATAISDDADALPPVLVAQLEEFVPNVKTKPFKEIRRLLNHDLHRFQIFKQQGQQIRWGRFTPEENQRIRDNMAHLLAVTGIATTDQLLFPHRYKGQEAEIRKLKRQHGFIEAIAEGIPRTCRQVLTRAWKLDNTNHMGEFSDEEIRRLIQLQKIHGNDWSAIGKKMGRSKYALQKRFAQTSSGRGAWTSEEAGRLKEAVKAHLEVMVRQSSADSEDGKLTLRQLCQRLPWVEISQSVQTRNWTQCRVKWFGVLRQRLSEKSQRKSPKLLRIKIQLISTLYALNIEDCRDIDWEEVSEILGDVTPVCVQKIFRNLKVGYVPNWSQLSYGEIIDFLQDRVAPRLQDQLHRYSHYVENDEGEQQLTANDAYALFDIFTSGEDFVEVDNTQRSKHWLERAPMTCEEVDQIMADDAQPNGQSEPLTSDT